MLNNIPEVGTIIEVLETSCWENEEVPYQVKGETCTIWGEIKDGDTIISSFFFEDRDDGELKKIYVDENSLSSYKEIGVDESVLKIKEVYGYGVEAQSEN